MTIQIDWLPNLELLSDHDGNWDRYLEAIYAIFRHDFVDSKPSFQGVRLGLKRHPIVNGKESTFWHIISSGDNEADRLPDMRRCERIRWPKPIIQSVPHADIKIWTEQRNGEERIHLWVEDEDYLLVLNKRRDYLLWTAFCVEWEHQKAKYNKRWNKYKENIEN